jgi:hypothetical protein
MDANVTADIEGAAGDDASRNLAGKIRADNEGPAKLHIE